MHVHAIISIRACFRPMSHIQTIPVTPLSPFSLRILTDMGAWQIQVQQLGMSRYKVRYLGTGYHDHVLNL